MAYSRRAKKTMRMAKTRYVSMALSVVDEGIGALDLKQNKINLSRFSIFKGQMDRGQKSLGSTNRVKKFFVVV